jgi:hypothetical protein
VFLDVRQRLVTLGACGPNTFDERGLLGLAFHPNYGHERTDLHYTSELKRARQRFRAPSRSAPRIHQNVVAEWRVPNPGNPASVVDRAAGASSCA